MWWQRVGHAWLIHTHLCMCVWVNAHILMKFLKMYTPVNITHIPIRILNMLMTYMISQSIAPTPRKQWLLWFWFSLLKVCFNSFRTPYGWNYIVYTLMFSFSQSGEHYKINTLFWYWCDVSTLFHFIAWQYCYIKKWSIFCHINK